MAEAERIAYTGAGGSLGSQMPPGGCPLRTRLEASVEERIAELRALSTAPRAFIHFAALTRVDECEKDPERARRLNVEGAMGWFKAAAAAGCERFVYVSTSHVFAPPRDREPLRPGSPVGPRSVYAKTKLAGELALQDARRDAPGLELTIARVFSILSDRMRPGFLLTGLTERARRRDFSPIPGLDNVRDFLDAREVCRTLVRLALTPGAPPLALVCSGRGTTVRELAESVFRRHGLDPGPLTAAPGRPDDAAYIVGEPTAF